MGGWVGHIGNRHMAHPDTSMAQAATAQHGCGDAHLEGQGGAGHGVSVYAFLGIGILGIRVFRVEFCARHLFWHSLVPVSGCKGPFLSKGSTQVACARSPAGAGAQPVCAVADTKLPLCPRATVTVSRPVGAGCGLKVQPLASLDDCSINSRGNTTRHAQGKARQGKGQVMQPRQDIGLAGACCARPGTNSSRQGTEQITIKASVLLPVVHHMPLLQPADPSAQLPPLPSPPLARCSTHSSPRHSSPQAAGSVPLWLY